MGEFAGAGAEAGKEAIKLAKEVAQEFRDTIGATFSGQKNLKLEFADPVGPTQLVDDDGPFKWKVERVVTYTSAYYSHIRATTGKQKKHGEKAREKIAKRGVSKEDRKKFNAEMQSSAVKLLQDNYKAKHKTRVAEIETKAKAAVADAQQKKATDNSVVVPDLAKLIHDGRRAMYDQFGGKYHVGIPDGCNDDSFAKLLAQAVVKSSEFEGRYDKYWFAALNKRAEQSVAAKNPTLKEDQVKGKLAKAATKEIQSAFHRSVVVCYQAQYQVLGIDAAEVDERWEKVADKLRKWESDERKSISGQAAGAQKVLKSYKELGEDAVKPDVLKRNVQVILDMDKKSQELDDLVKEKKTQMSEKKKEVQELVKNKKRMGAFWIYPVASHDDLETGIKFRNTNAGMQAKVARTMNDNVKVTMSFDETGKTGIPFANGMFDGHFTTMGTITFELGPNGTPKDPVGDGKIGSKFADLVAFEVK